MAEKENKIFMKISLFHIHIWREITLGILKFYFDENYGDTGLQH